eukprot:6009389-Pleurochrysis_carterae.AAC.1
MGVCDCDLRSALVDVCLTYQLATRGVARVQFLSFSLLLLTAPKVRRGRSVFFRALVPYRPHGTKKATRARPLPLPLPLAAPDVC